jgi:Prokaryotic RING finger family 1
MTSTQVGADEAGRTCPYCRFPLKRDVPSVDCDACGAVYHAECWQEGGGCAILGCPNAVAGAGAATAPGLPPAEAPPPRRAYAPASRGNRTLLVGILAGVLLAAAAVAAFLVVHGSASGGHASPPAPVTVTSNAPPPASSPPSPEEEAATELADVVQLSEEGRAAVVAHEYGAAIANRRAVLTRLRGVRPRTARLARAKAAFARAMQMSLRSDERYANGLDATGTDKAATRLKRRFVRLFDPVASEYGLQRFSADDI